MNAVGWMAQPPVGVDEQSTRHTSTPKGRFVLRADAIRPYSCGGKAADRSTYSSTPTRAYRLKVCTAWLPPGGSWIFYQAALRNRLIKKTDEGRRTVGQEMQLDERYMFQIVPFNREIQNF